MASHDSLSAQIAVSGVFRRFVASPFEDMKGERDALARRVFPSIRQRCEQRGVSFADVDLRWGITAAEAAEGRVLALCFEEIDRCRPGLIVLLGNRYGSVAGDIPSDLVRREPWLSAPALRDASVTELEIHHGLLRRPDAARASLCYLRTREIAWSRPSPADDRLERLKQAVRGTGCPVREYDTVEQFASLIECDLARCVDESVPRLDDATGDGREARAHEALRQIRARAFVNVPGGFRTLERHVESGGPPLVITGPAGCGKTTWLAAWLAWRKAPAEGREPLSAVRHFFASHARPSPADHTWFHFVGATAASTDRRRLTERFVRDVERWTGVHIAGGESPSDQRAAFSRALGAAATSGRTLMILDGIERIEASAEARLGWLPPELPANLRLIVAAAPGDDCRVLESRGWAVHEVPAWPVADRHRFIETFLSRYGKRLSPGSQRRIAEHSRTQSLFFLRTLLEELRLTGAFASLETDVDRYLSRESDLALCEEVLRRIEADDFPTSGVMRRLLVLISSAHDGLTEAELLDAAGSADVRASPLLWARLRTSLGDAIIERSGTLAMINPIWRDAVRTRCITNANMLRATAARLASIFERASLLRQVQELPWHYIAAHDRQALRTRLVDADFLEAAWLSAPHDLQSWWSTAFLNDPAGGPPVLGALAKRTAHRIVGVLMRRGGAADIAVTIATADAESAQETGDRTRLVAALADLALAQRASGGLNAALATLRRLEPLCRQEGNQEALRICLGNQAVVLKELGAKDEARNILERLVNASRAPLDEPTLASALLNRADLLMDARPADALLSLREAERLFRSLGDRDGLAAALGNLAALEYPSHRRRALLRQDEELAILTALGHRAGVALACARHASVAARSLDMDRALELCQRGRATADSTMPEAIFRCLLVEASVMFNLGIADQARTLLSQALALGRVHPNIDASEASGLARRLGVLH